MLSFSNIYVYTLFQFFYKLWVYDVIWLLICYDYEFIKILRFKNILYHIKSKYHKIVNVTDYVFKFDNRSIYSILLKQEGGSTLLLLLLKQIGYVVRGL